MHCVGAEATTLGNELQRLQQELAEAHRGINERETKLGAQEQKMQDLTMSIDDVMEELKVRERERERERVYKYPHPYTVYKTVLVIIIVITIIHKNSLTPYTLAHTHRMLME